MNGTRAALNASDGKVISPSCALKGTLIRLISRKNHAAVPTKASFGNATAKRYKPITGPAALASIVVTPATRPIVHANAVECGNRANRSGFQLRPNWTSASASTMPPITGLNLAAGSCAACAQRMMPQPMATPATAGGNVRAMCGHRASRRKSSTAPMSPQTSIGSTTPVEARPGKSCAKITTCSRLMPGNPLLDTPMPTPASAASSHWTAVKSGSTKRAASRLRVPATSGQNA